MELAIHILVLLAGTLLVLAMLVIGIVDMFGRVDYLRDNVPWLSKILERRGALATLGLVGVLLVAADLYEFAIHELPPQVESPKFTIPPPPAPTVTMVQPPIQVVLPPTPPKHARILYSQPPQTLRDNPLIPYHENQVPALNIGTNNASEEIQIVNSFRYAQVVVLSWPETAELNLRKYFDEMRKMPHSDGGYTIPPHGDGGMNTYSGEPLTKQDVSDLDDGTKGVCGLSAAFWQDESGRYETDFAYCYFKEPSVPGLFNWRMLPMNQRETKIGNVH